MICLQQDGCKQAGMQGWRIFGIQEERQLWQEQASDLFQGAAATDAERDLWATEYKKCVTTACIKCCPGTWLLPLVRNLLGFSVKCRCQVCV